MRQVYQNSLNKPFLKGTQVLNGEHKNRQPPLFFLSSVLYRIVPSLEHLHCSLIFAILQFSPYLIKCHQLSDINIAMNPFPDFAVRHYLIDDGVDATQSHTPPGIPSQRDNTEAMEQQVERASIDSTSSSRRNSIQGHLERLRRRTDFNISGELMVDAIQAHYEEVSPKNPVWDWFALDNVFHRPAPSSRGDLKHLMRPLSPNSLPDRDQVELERAVRAYEGRLHAGEEAEPRDTTTNAAHLNSSAPVPDAQYARPELDKNGIPFFQPPSQFQSKKRKHSNDADGPERHKKVRHDKPLP